MKLWHFISSSRMIPLAVCAGLVMIAVGVIGAGMVRSGNGLDADHRVLGQQHQAPLQTTKAADLRQE